MINVLDKKEFYRMALCDRLAIARISFPTSGEQGSIEFFNTPIGTAVRARVGGGERLIEIKMYDRNRGKFELSNAYCEENLVAMDDGTLIGISGRVRIEDVVGRDFLVRIGESTIIASAQRMGGLSKICS